MLHRSDKKTQSPENNVHVRPNPGPLVSSSAAARPARAAGMQHDMMRMQSLVGNRALQRMVAGIPTARAPIQRMNDPDNKNREILEAMYQRIYNRVKARLGMLCTLPQPSRPAIKTQIVRAIAKATDLHNALEILVDHVKDEYFGHMDSTEQGNWRERMIQMGKNAQKAEIEKQERKKRDLDALQDDSKADPALEEEHPRKKARTEFKGDMEFFKNKQNLELVRKKLQDPFVRNKIMASSEFAHNRLSAMSRLSIAKLAKHNELVKEKQPLGIAEILSAQNHYTRAKTGKALVLERGSGYQVTMSRRGGQEINQLGPYLPGSRKKSVQETVRELLGNNFTTRDLARAIETRDPGRVGNTYNLEGNRLRDVRSMRYLFGIERSRAPEVSISTTMEHRMASLGMTHMDDYVTHHPMAPPKATTNIVNARKQAEENGQDYGYVPQNIQDRAFGTLGRLADHAFGKPPTEDPSVGLLLREIALMKEEEGKSGGEAGDSNLSKAMQLGMMSPPYVWPEDRQHEHVDMYTQLYNQLMGIAEEKAKDGETKMETEEKKDTEKDAGAGALSGLAPTGVGNESRLPVKGLPNMPRSGGNAFEKSASDCFINAIIQLMAEPYADYFDTTKHILRSTTGRDIQHKVSDAMKMVRGVNPHDRGGIGRLREELRASKMVEGLVGHEDASELMHRLLYAVTNLEGFEISIPVVPIRAHVMKKDETLADVALREGCDLNELQSQNLLLDTSPILLKVQSTKTIRKATEIQSARNDSSAYTGGQNTSESERGPGMEPIDIELFDDFDDYLEHTFGKRALLTTLGDNNSYTVIDDGKPKSVSQYSEQRRMLIIPKVLTFHLKRFKETEYGRVKNDKSFVMPTTFKLAEHSGGRGKEKTFGLSGVVRHTGGTEGGHYTADVSRGDKWYHADDEHVDEMTGEEDRMTRGYIYTYVMTAEQDL